MIRNVIFDYDGTLVDTESLYSRNYAETMLRYGVVCDLKDRKSFYGYDPFEKAAKIIQRYGVTFDVEEAAREYRKLNAERFPENVKTLLFDDVVSSLEYCQSKGMRLFVCSNTQSDRIKEILEEIGILHYFEGISGRDLSQARKPSPIPYQYLLNEYGLKKEETLAIEDSNGGIISAKAAGIKTVGLCRVLTKDELNADYHIDSLSELNSII